MTNEDLKQKEHKARVSYSRFIYGLVFIPLIVLAFKKAIAPEPPKTYTVTLSLDEWRGVLQAIDTSSKLLNKSDLPVREVIFANQSLAQVNQAIQFQVSAQLQAEAKKDSTNASKPKNK